MVEFNVGDQVIVDPESQNDLLGLSTSSGKVYGRVGFHFCSVGDLVCTVDRVMGDGFYYVYSKADDLSQYVRGEFLRPVVVIEDSETETDPTVCSEGGSLLKDGVCLWRVFGKLTIS